MMLYIVMSNIFLWCVHGPVKIDELTENEGVDIG